MKTDYIKDIPDAERRHAVADMKVEKRAAATDGAPEDFVVQGYAAIFNSPTTIHNYFREEILPGAFDDVLGDDIRALFNHDPNKILGRTAAKTLEVGIDAKGFWYRYTTPDYTYAQDLAKAIERGDISESSFAFRVAETLWHQYENDELDLRQIVKFEKIYDVSPVTYPAYADTTVAKRSHDVFLAKQKDIDNENGTRTDKHTELSLIDAQIFINENNAD